MPKPINMQVVLQLKITFVCNDLRMEINRLVSSESTVDQF